MRSVWHISGLIKVRISQLSVWILGLRLRYKEIVKKVDKMKLWPVIIQRVTCVSPVANDEGGDNKLFLISFHCIYFLQGDSLFDHSSECTYVASWLMKDF